MGSLLVALIILGCVAYLYFKGTLVKSFVVIITSICASVVAFGYFELLANVFIKNKILVLWSYTLSFVLLFIVAFAVLQTIASQLTRKPVDFGLLPERIGRVICGIFSSLIISGFLLTAAAMAPIPAKYPYQRFNAASPDAEKPSGVLLNADGFTTGWFSIVSSGSFSGKNSFAVLHPAFLDQLFLNRLEIDKKIPITSTSGTIEIPKVAVWPVPEGLKDSDGKPIQPKSGYNLTIIRIAMTSEATRDGFTLSQLRVICKQKNGGSDALTGKGINIYPAGYLKTADELQMKKLNDHVEVKSSDFIGRTKEIDFAFYVPDGFVPVLVEFRQNCIKQLPPPISAEQAPPAVPFEKPVEIKVIEPNKPVEQPNSPAAPKPKEQPQASSPRPAPAGSEKPAAGGQPDENP